MNSLKGRLLIILVGALLALAVVACGGFAYLTLKAAGENALAAASDVADGAAQAAAGLMGSQPDHEKVAGKLAQGFAKNHQQGSIVLFGRSGKVFGALPTRQHKIDYTVDPDCKVCHLDSSAMTGSVIHERPDGHKVALAISPIVSEGACRQCHTLVAKPLGWVMVELPMEELADEAAHDIILIGSLISFVGVAIFLAAFLLVDKLVLTPMTGVFRGLREIARGNLDELPQGRLPMELDGLFDQFAEVSRSLNEMRERIPELAAQATGDTGRLSARLAEVRERARGQGELVAQLDSMMTRLSRDVRGANVSVDLIASSSGDNSTNLTELTQSVGKVASDAGELANQVKRSTGSVQQMNRSVQAVSEHLDMLVQRVDSAAGRVNFIGSSANEIAENANQASSLSGEMANSAIVGADAVGMISNSIKTSYQEITVAADSMRKLKLASRSVGDILKIINDINEKTKLLALNAAIIAAQAGEQGRSFAVVAHEIKGLSDRTASSTGDIARIIDAIQESVEMALGNVSRGEERIGDSVEAVAMAGSLLSGISQTANESFSRTRLIGDAARRQMQLSTEVSASVVQVAGAVEEIRRRVKEHTTSALLLEEAAQTMNNLTDEVRGSTKEQAEGARHLSEAFTIIDMHMKGVVKAVAGNEEIAREAQAMIDRAKGSVEIFSHNAAQAEKLLEEMKMNLSRLMDAVAQKENGGEG